MSDTPNTEMGFISQAENIIEDNLSNEQFGVSELAQALNMSRSNLLRKIRKHSDLSASQFIRQHRLKKGMELLKQNTLTVSEIAFQVGFGSTSYFIKCFREYYGHPPGELGKIKTEEIKEDKKEQVVTSKKSYLLIIGGAILILLLLLFFLLKSPPASPTIELEKSIAVLPFKNDSNDSSNLYFVNGLMESALSNLQKIEDLRVISRTSVEKYRNTDKTIPEIAQELKVSYFVEGSGQRVGDEILLNIQLIEAETDKHIWAEQYSRKVVDVFALQNEIAKKIADAIEVIVTPAELEKIEKNPTDNLQAYDYFLQALDPFYARTEEGLKKAIFLLEQAIQQDPQFALAHAKLAISYYFLDENQVEKQYTALINNYADKALLHDSKSDESLIAKALYYMANQEYQSAIPHLEKALEYNPNSTAVVQTLASIYAFYLPNTAKYLEYALKGIQLDIAANDSTTNSYIYLQLSNALIQNGFVDEALQFINKSLKHDPNNYFAPHVKAVILYAKNRDLDQTQKRLLTEWKKDTTRLDLLQEIAKFFFYQEKYDSAFYYFEKFAASRKRNGLNIYPQEDIKIAKVYELMGLDEQAADFFNAYVEYCKNDQSIYKSASLATLYAQEGKLDQAIEQLNIFATQDNFQYWVLPFLEVDPLLNPLKNHPDFEATIQKIKNRFWNNQEKLSKSLLEKGLL